MNDKGFESDITLDETPHFDVTEEKPLEITKKQSKKVDINVLLNRVKLDQIKESRKKIIFTAATSLGLVIFGVLIF